MAKQEKSSMSTNVANPTDAAKAAVDAAKAAVDANKAKEPGKKARPAIESWPAFFKTEAEAVAEASKRTQGPARAFRVNVPKGIEKGTYFTVAHGNIHIGPLFMQMAGVEVVEIGKAPRAPRAGGQSELLKLSKMSPEERTEAAKSYTPEQKAELKKQAEELQKLLAALK